tara:strand:- start:377 stop:532 length:156 start_codon:yes stop_codon:yes gene_type:complete
MLREHAIPKEFDLSGCCFEQHLDFIVAMLFTIPNVMGPQGLEAHTSRQPLA